MAHPALYQRAINRLARSTPPPILHTMGKPCDRLSTEHADHDGPFSFVETFLDGNQVSAIERCGACGKIVLRQPKEQDLTDPGTGLLRSQ